MAMLGNKTQPQLSSRTGYKSIVKPDTESNLLKTGMHNPRSDPTRYPVALVILGRSRCVVAVQCGWAAGCGEDTASSRNPGKGNGKHNIRDDAHPQAGNALASRCCRWRG